MTDNTHATLRASVEQFEEMIKQSSLSGETEHSDLYLNVLEDEVRILQNAPGDVVLTFCSFGSDYFDDIDLQRDVRTMEATDTQGDTFEFEVGAEAILDVEQTLTYLDFASDGGTVELRFTGSDDRRLSTYARAEGALEAWVKLPGSEDILSDVPHWLPSRFNADERYTNTAGDEAPTKIQTRASNIDTIVDAVDDDRDAEFYPIVIDGGQLTIDVGDEQRSGVRGALGAQAVDGPDVENYYYDGFEEIFSVLSGPVELQTAPGNNPMAVVQTDDQGRTIRHVNGTVNK